MFVTCFKNSFFTLNDFWTFCSRMFTRKHFFILCVSELNGRAFALGQDGVIVLGVFVPVVALVLAGVCAWTLWQRVKGARFHTLMYDPFLDRMVWQKRFSPLKQPQSMTTRMVSSTAHLALAPFPLLSALTTDSFALAQDWSGTGGVSTGARVSDHNRWGHNTCRSVSKTVALHGDFLENPDPHDTRHATWEDCQNPDLGKTAAFYVGDRRHVYCQENPSSLLPPNPHHQQHILGLEPPSLCLYNNAYLAPVETLVNSGLASKQAKKRKWMKFSHWRTRYASGMAKSIPTKRSCVPDLKKTDRRKDNFPAFQDLCKLKKPVEKQPPHVQPMYNARKGLNSYMYVPRGKGGYSQLQLDHSFGDRKLDSTQTPPLLPARSCLKRHSQTKMAVKKNVTFSQSCGKSRARTRRNKSSFLRRTFSKHSALSTPGRPKRKCQRSAGARHEGGLPAMTEEMIPVSASRCEPVSHVYIPAFPLSPSHSPSQTAVTTGQLGTHFYDGNNSMYKVENYLPPATTADAIHSCDDVSEQDVSDQDDSWSSNVPSDESYLTSGIDQASLVWACDCSSTNESTLWLSPSSETPFPSPTTSPTGSHDTYSLWPVDDTSVCSKGSSSYSDQRLGHQDVTIRNEDGLQRKEICSREASLPRDFSYRPPLRSVSTSTPKRGRSTMSPYSVYLPTSAQRGRSPLYPQARCHSLMEQSSLDSSALFHSALSEWNSSGSYVTASDVSVTSDLEPVRW